MTATVGSDEWCADQGTLAEPYAGDTPHTIDVVVAADRSGDGFTYHVSLRPGERPQYTPGPARGGAAATLEMGRTEAEAQASGALSLAVAYMRGTTKTKGATRPLYELLRLLP